MVASFGRPRQFHVTHSIAKTDIMVRFKNRYLLFEIIYADTPLGYTSIPAATASALDVANQPSGEESPFGDTGRNNCRLPPLANKDLVFALKDSIAENFGDYGAGLTQRPLTCKAQD